MNRLNKQNELDMIIEYLSGAQTAFNLALRQAELMSNELGIPIITLIERVSLGNSRLLESIKQEAVEQVGARADTSAGAWQQSLKPSSGSLTRNMSSPTRRIDSSSAQRPQSAISPAIQKLCQSYNAIVDDPGQRDEFMRLYNPIRVTAINAMKRRRDPNVKPIFQTANNGEYYALSVDDRGLYPVLPCLGLAIQESIYSPGAMGQVFDCPGYSPKFRYRRSKIVKPAFFTPDAAKQRWTLKKKGILDLGKGD